MCNFHYYCSISRQLLLTKGLPTEIRTGPKGDPWTTSKMGWASHPSRQKQPRTKAAGVSWRPSFRSDVVCEFFPAKTRTTNKLTSHPSATRPQPKAPEPARENPRSASAHDSRHLPHVVGLLPWPTLRRDLLFSDERHSSKDSCSLTGLRVDRKSSMNQMDSFLHAHQA
jgi:hypothetical protein